MDPEHTITPPPELVERLQDLEPLEAIRLAYRAGADMELEGCGKWFKSQGYHPEVYRDLHAARRPKPKSQAEEALNLLDDVSGRLDGAHENGIRRALERLRELEDSNSKLPTPVVSEPPTGIVLEDIRYTRADLVSLEERGGMVIGGVEYLPSKTD